MQDLLTELADCLAQVGVHDWSRTMIRLRESCGAEQSPEAMKAGARLVLTLFGGSGSFNDLVLGSPDHPAREANNRLDALRHQLYLLAVEVLAS